MKLIDLHCHILPGVDDGAKDQTMALKLAQAAVEQGISHILLTPHHMDSHYLNHKKDVIEKTALFQRALVSEGIPLKVFPGQEVHLTGNLLDAVLTNDILFMDAGNRYLLLEFPHNEVPEYAEDMVFELTSRGITPVIAHPERNLGFQKKPDKLYDFVKMGCLTQLTSSSYMGVFGDKVQELTEKIIKANLGFAFASDAHNFEGRRFMMKEAFEKLVEREGSAVAEQFNLNAKNILNGEDVDTSDVKRVSNVKRKRFFGLF
ncbi:tyrosine protein phosphatase [Companilactobacillus zhachilii]|uniref:Tyrosine-protein phosphatase n=1 Tax=Companilactobacillus zhachilii TaxID=2304606 RepID=A0A386PWV2_9LACO|nr:CpsB/CapC family capsule biosynthesis tyrosine phosphatase [Companilactobacillus zhachilii]AYE39030.1 tyrosine protein phosphatase [Companilactobacillus zhachilii]